MAEVAHAAPPIAPLPTAETTVRLPPWVERWLERGAPYATLLAIGLPVFALVNVFLIGFAGDGCNECGAFELYGLLSFGAAITLFTLSVATLLGRASAKRAQRDQLGPWLGLAQSAKGWFVRGDITEDEYERIRSHLEPALEGNTDDHRVRSAASLLTWVAIISGVFLAPLLLISLLLVVDGADGFLLVLGIPLFTLFLLVLAVTSLTVGLRSHRVAKELGSQLVARLRRLEEEILKTAHQRSRKGPETTPANPYGPSFRSYAGR